MNKRLVAGGCGIVFVIVLFIVIFYFVSGGEYAADEVVSFNKELVASIGTPKAIVSGAHEISVNWDAYNYDFVDENVKGILTRMIGASGKTAFYLPPIGYINVSRGTKFGVAFALNNPNPSGENYFEYDWTVDDSVVKDCGVDVDVAQGWIERGWKSWGKIPPGWIDHMTVYFSFPSDIEPCSVKYNFVILKDGAFYDSKQIKFNLF